jgi:hypothetical protein
MYINVGIALGKGMNANKGTWFLICTRIAGAATL